MHAALLLSILALPGSLPLPSPPQPTPLRFHAEDDGDLARADLEFALDELEKQCRELMRVKEINWKAVRKEMTKEVRSVKDRSAHLALLVRLLARLQDGHCAVQPGADWPEGEELPWPKEWREKRVGSGILFCQIDGDLFIRNAWGGAAGTGFKAGMEVVSVDGTKAGKWFDALMERTADRASFSTDQHRFFGTSRWGLSEPPGTRLKFELREGSKKKKRTLTFDRDRTYIEGPAVTPQGVRELGRSVRVGRTPGGFGYLHFRRVDKNILSETDQALAELQDAPGLVVDFRANAGGGCDHDALEARFVPKGAKLQRLARSPLESQGPNPYGGPMVIIIDGSVVSAGETTSGMFKEDGRAYAIGDSPTAGMSSQKTTIQLPSGLFALYVSVRSNRQSFNEGRGIEGIGVAPHEELDYDAEELAEGIDTMIRRADEILAKPPRDWSKHVRYDPSAHGWEPR